MNARTQNRWIRRKGSALIYVSVMMVAITTVVIGSVSVNVAAAKKATRRIDEAKAEETFNAQVALVRSLCKTNAITLPYTFSSTINGRQLDCTVTDNASELDRTYKITATTVSGEPYTFSKVIGGRQTTHPLYYALWSNDNLDFSTEPLITRNLGHVLTRGNILLGASTISGDVISSGTLNAGTAAVDKNVFSGLSADTLPAPDMAALKAETGLVTSLLSVVNLTFLALMVNGHYRLMYYDKNLAFGGTLTGKGTAVFEQGVRVTSDVIYANGTSRVVFIVDGDLDVDKAVNRLDGYWYVTGKFIAKGTTNPLVVGRGAIAFAGTADIRRPLDITYDPSIFAVRSEGYKHCAPIFWPTSNPNLMR